MRNLSQYCESVLSFFGHKTNEGEVFAKILSPNDDSGRHGVVIPVDTYSFFPELLINDPKLNETKLLEVLDRQAGKPRSIAYKYYERYPERRLTRLGHILNDRQSESRLLIVIKTKDTSGHFKYYIDSVNSTEKRRFNDSFLSIFGNSVSPSSGLFIVRPISVNSFLPDSALTDLLEKFDGIKSTGWINSMRSGDTGIGYTFETLLGIKENNDQTADFKGIELKCKKIKQGATTESGKVNLFQLGPKWTFGETSIERLKHLGKPNEAGHFTCYSQVTTKPNNLGLNLTHDPKYSRIDLQRLNQQIGYWPFEILEKRLIEKHSRTAFVKAKTRKRNGIIQYSYEELVYCENPDIGRFIDQVLNHHIVFEFTMSEKANNTVRNHGYPWRLVRSEFLDQLFSFQIKLR